MNTREQKLHITDERGDILELQTVEFDEDVDWTDDEQAILAAVRVNSNQHVNLNRADLRELHAFAGEILAADDAVLNGEDDE